MATDPYKYFRVEARELLDGLTEGVHELERGNADRERVNSLLRLAHTLKGAARVVKQPAMAELAHRIEEILAPFRDDSRAIPEHDARTMLQMLDQIGSGLAALALPEQSPAAASRIAAADQIETVRVEVEEVETLLGRLANLGTELASVERVGEMANQARRQASFLPQLLQAQAENSPGSARARLLAEQLQDSLQALSRRLAESLERMIREFDQSRELANQLRLLPSAAIFPALDRVVKDAAAALGKQARLGTSGGDIRLDAHVLTGLRDAFLQLLRNAVAHGIEDPARRLSAGKPVCGKIDFTIERRGNLVAFLCRDDGAGIDLSAIRRVAVQKGVISLAQAESLGLEEAVDIIFRGGLSTAGHVSEIAGRGIGLDIVRAAVVRLRGEIRVETTPGQGVSVEILVPVSLSSVPSLTVDSGDTIASLPLDCVRETRRIDIGEVACCGAQESIAYQGQAIPFLPLASALRDPDAAPSSSRRWSAVIVASGTARAAIGVERLMRTGTVLVRALPPLAPAAAVINGATFDSEGNAQLFLDPAALVSAANRDRRQTQVRDEGGAPVLVIDDSLTTRMVEQSVLESAGYRVDLATSGEEALRKALANRYSLFLVDVEMPGMNGFEFISRTRADPTLREIPAILVTSRMSPEDRRRGEEAGALAYIVKSEFDQNVFLKTVQRLVN